MSDDNVCDLSIGFDIEKDVVDCFFNFGIDVFWNCIRVDNSVNRFVLYLVGYFFNILNVVYMVFND